MGGRIEDSILEPLMWPCEARVQELVDPGPIRIRWNTERMDGSRFEELEPITSGTSMSASRAANSWSSPVSLDPGNPPLPSTHCMQRDSDVMLSP